MSLDNLSKEELIEIIHRQAKHIDQLTAKFEELQKQLAKGQWKISRWTTRA